MSSHRQCVAYSGMLVALLAAAPRPAVAQDSDPAPEPAVAETTVAETAAAIGAATTPTVAAAPAQDAAKPPDGFKVGDFTFKPGGRVKLDIIQDFKPIDNTTSFVVQSIPIGAIPDTNSNLFANETRLNIDIRGKVDDNDVRMFIEGDFYGSGTTFRLRHAYGTWKGLLAGQYWSTFVDEDNLPRTIDFEAPTAFAQIRQAQLRYTRKFKWGTWASAVEDNKSTIVLPANIPGEAQFPSPDFATHLRFWFGSGHIQWSAFVGAARFRPNAVDDDPKPDNDPDTVPLWGTAVSANFTTVGRDSAYGVVTYGDGIGRYRGGITAVPDLNGLMHPVQVAAFMGGYEHFWAARWSTNAVYSFGDVTPESFYTADDNRQLTYTAVNLLWWFLGDRGWMGIEYLYGKRVVFGGEPNSATADRLQYGVRFNLP